MTFNIRRAPRFFLSFFASSLLACMSVSSAAAQTPKLDAMARVSAHPDLAAKTRLAGHLPRWEAAAEDLGTLAPDRQLDHLTVTLSRPPALEAEFQQLLQDQQNPSSPRYHQWLTPRQSAELYGAPQADSDAVAAWLQSQGLRVDSVSPNRLVLTFSGPAATVASAFGVQLHNFQHLGRTAYAATAEPAIPAAFASVIQGFAGLSEEYLAPQHIQLPTQPAQTPGSYMTPSVNLSSGSVHWLAPADFNLIYDVTPVLNTGITGTGQHVAIIGGSRVLAADISAFETLTGLPAAQPVTLLTPGSVDPGLTSNANQSEATLDVDRVLATAPGSTADLVLISSLLNTQILSSLQYIVNTLNDPIINMSFGACEYNSSASTQNTFNTILSQAASQGISIFVSSGDSEAAGCMTAGGPYTPSLAIASTNVLCTQYVTCVGGTQFSDLASPSTYWSSTNGTNYLSVLKYIPEGAWNEPTSTSSSGVVSYVVEGGGGGPSMYLTKPTWQVGTGVPADGVRDTPDISFSSSGHNAYLACLTYSGAVCPTNVTGFAGTSAAAPSMAGIMALVNQKTAVRQGLFNAKLYQYALLTSNNVFHDATPATSGVTTCSLLTASTCNTSSPGLTGLTGGVSGAALTTGYDLATGLGSIDVANLITAITTVPAASTTTTLTATPATITTNGSTVFKATITSGTAGSPTGTVAFTLNGVSLGSGTLSAGSATMSSSAFPTAGTYAVTAAYSGDSTFAASTAVLNFIVTQGPSFSVTLSGAPTPIVSGNSGTFTATYASLGGFVGTITPTCSVTASFSSPVLPTCSAATVTLSGTAPSVANVFTLSTTKHNASPANGAVAALTGRALGGMALSALLLCLLPRRRKAFGGWRALPLALLLSASLFAASGCSSSTAASAPAATGTTAGTYNVTVTSVSGSISIQITTSVTVQ